MLFKKQLISRYVPFIKDVAAVPVKALPPLHLHPPPPPLVCLLFSKPVG